MDGKSAEEIQIMNQLEIREVSAESPLISMITALVSLDMKYSDILIHEDCDIMVRMSRGWIPLPDLGLILKGKIEDFFSSMDSSWQNKLTPHLDEESKISKRLNFSRDLELARIRVNGFVHGDRKLGIAIRRIPKEIPALADLGLPFGIADIAQKNRGLILITGPVGNGKSTTMAALLKYISSLKANHILTLEDPLEFIHMSDKSIFTQREIPKHASTFKEGFEEALRERPDVIAIGELRNKDTVETCLEGSDAGLLMIATMHANNASSAVTKFLNFYSDNEVKQKAAQLADCLIAIVSQTLVPAKDGIGSVMAYEILMNNSQTQQAISKLEVDKIRTLLAADITPGTRLKSNTLNFSLAELVKKEKITKTDALNYCYDKDDLEKELNKAR